MKGSFLDVYTKLKQGMPADINVSGLWLAHGDEPLLHQWLADAMRPIWRSQNLSIQRIELVSAKTWQDVLTELNSLSLFDDATAVIVTGNHKPDKHMQSELESFAIEANSGTNQTGTNQNCVLWLTAKVDNRSQSSKWFAPFAKYGNIIDCNLYNENQRQQILSVHARLLGLNLTPDAWQFLMVQTEHHLLSAYQALWRLSYLFAPQIAAQIAQPAVMTDTTPSAPSALSTGSNLNDASTSQPVIQASKPVTVDVDALQNALVSGGQYTIFDLSDAMLSGNASQVVRIIEQLKSTEEPTPLVLWAVSKDMRLIMQLLSGENPRELGIWSSKQSVYQAACRRQNPQSISDWPDLLYQCDKAVKGVIRQPAWELLLQAALRVSGYELFH